MGDIGVNPREYEFEPVEIPAPMTEPAPVVQPARPEPQKVPVPA